MQRYFTKTFVVFLIGFLCIIGVAFGIMAFVSTENPTPVAPVDNTAARS